VPNPKEIASDSIRFILDGEPVCIRNPDPTRTVLQYLRDDLRRIGTKEGCAEGDCGACTVVLAELTHDGNDLALKAINACIRFLPTLDGKELITVESLAGNCENLHPVQQAMVDCHGSQCGFCTPGFVMSLFALYKSNACANGQQPARRAIDDSLAGNLCRCTGYRPIIAAAQKMSALAVGENPGDWLSTPGHDRQAAAAGIARLQSIQRAGAFSGLRDGNAFIAPRSIAELADALADNPDATLLAGGTDVGLWVTKQYRELGTVVYIGEIEALGVLQENDTGLEIGSTVTVTDAMTAIAHLFPEFDEVFRRFASPPIRNAATLGGNIANGSPIGDSMPALMVIGARLVLNSVQGRREMALEDFYLDYMVNALQPGEFVESIRIPRRQTAAKLSCYKISKRFDQDISSVCAAFSLLFDGEIIVAARIAMGGMAAVVKRARHAEQALAGQAWNQATLAKGMEALLQDFEPLSDFRATAAYRMRVAQNLLQRFYLETHGEQKQSLYEYGRAI
jgi:xanthine dehydrogenase small subunit